MASQLDLVMEVPPVGFSPSEDEPYRGIDRIVQGRSTLGGIDGGICSLIDVPQRETVLAKTTKLSESESES